LQVLLRFRSEAPFRSAVHLERARLARHRLSLGVTQERNEGGKRASFDAILIVLRIHHFILIQLIIITTNST